MIRWVLALALVIALLTSPFLASPASAAEVNQTLIAVNTSWHVGSASSINTQITVNVGDVLHLTIRNEEISNIFHTFTAPHFPAASGQGSSDTTLNVNMPEGNEFVWNHTFTSADVGTWEYYCIPHSGGTPRTGMVGTIRVTQPAPPPTPGFEVVLVIAALGIVAVAVRALPRRRT